VWGDEYENVLFCDNNKFCQQVIKKNFGKDSVIYGDIREVTANSICSRKLQSQRFEQDKWERIVNSIDILTAGVPCQPASIAGKRMGEEDDRWLWPETFRVIRKTNPTWCVIENVCGLLTLGNGVVFEKLLVELESYGYEVQPIVVPACGVGAPHRRKRIWIIAYHAPSVGYGEENKIQAGRDGVVCSDKFNSYSISERLSGNVRGQFPKLSKKIESSQGSEYGRISSASKQWSQNWLEVATKLCGVDDGLPAELDGFKLTKAGHRVERLKALGNSIVPQVVIEIFKAIKKLDTNPKGD
jgi:DNA (cytosine-5)-methyltransferase 1